MDIAARLYTKIGVLLHFYSVFRIIHEKVRVSELQYSIFLRSYLKIRERKKLERKKVRAQPLCHLNNPPTNPFDLLDISMLLYHKETVRLDGESKFVEGSWRRTNVNSTYSGRSLWRSKNSFKSECSRSWNRYRELQWVPHNTKLLVFEKQFNATCGF